MAKKKIATTPKQPPKAKRKLPEGAIRISHTFAVNSTLALPQRGIEEVPWKDFMVMLHRGWREVTDLSNWAVLQCLRHDNIPTTPSGFRVPGPDGKFPPFPFFPPWPDMPYPADWQGIRQKKGHLNGLYGLASTTLRFDRPDNIWHGNAYLASGILNYVETKYKRERFDILCRGTERAPLFRYPAPLPVPLTHWEAHWIDEHPVLVLTLLHGDKVAVKMRGGKEYRRQIAAFKCVVRDHSLGGQLLITRQRDSGSNRQGTTAREAGDKVHHRIMLRLPILSFPADTPSFERVVHLHTDPEAFWVAEVDGRKVWIMNADHVKSAWSWHQVHTPRRQRWAEDLKAERRADPRKMQQFQASRDRCCSKHDRRMDSWCQEITAHFVRFAISRKITQVCYQDQVSNYLPAFPWYKMRTLLSYKLKLAGIQFDAPPEKKTDPEKELILPVPESDSSEISGAAG